MKCRANGRLWLKAFEISMASTKLQKTIHQAQEKNSLRSNPFAQIRVSNDFAQVCAYPMSVHEWISKSLAVQCQSKLKFSNRKHIVSISFFEPQASIFRTFLFGCLNTTNRKRLDTKNVLLRLHRVWAFPQILRDLDQCSSFRTGWNRYCGFTKTLFECCDPCDYVKWDENMTVNQFAFFSNHDPQKFQNLICFHKIFRTTILFLRLIGFSTIENETQNCMKLKLK